jgi:hypothetical protein
MLNLNSTLLQEVADQALIDAAAHPRWVVAIGRALIELDQNPWVERASTGHGLIIGSPSGTCYSANGTCTCEAFKHGQPCYHRAMARMVRRHDEREATAAIEAQIVTVVDRAFAPLHERLAKARAEINELFA